MKNVRHKEINNQLRDPEDRSLFLSSIIRCVSRRLVSANCVAITTKHKLIIKNAPTCRQTITISKIEFNLIIFF